MHPSILLLFILFIIYLFFIIFGAPIYFSII